ncbi:MAG: hypothetical protein BWZ08_02312 [candidate division BRC1 bacterium ADurb.BinA292]|nr:MAG: hypothetical protein BWZ08_02312 [candidate division BRC1 bacterium ADurb.BinA292]
MYGEPVRATHLRLTCARADAELIAVRRRARRMELITAAVLAALTILITVACMSVVGWAAAKFAMGY